MKTKMIYLGRLTIAAALTAATQALAGGDPVDQLAGYQIKDVVLNERTTLAKTGTVTLAFQTSNDVAITTAADLVGNAHNREIYNPLNVVLGAADVTAPFEVVAVGAGSIDAGVVDVYAEVFLPRLA